MGEQKPVSKAPGGLSQRVGERVGERVGAMLTARGPLLRSLLPAVELGLAGVRVPRQLGLAPGGVPPAPRLGRPLAVEEHEDGLLVARLLAAPRELDARALPEDGAGGHEQAQVRRARQPRQRRLLHVVNLRERRPVSRFSRPRAFSPTHLPARGVRSDVVDVEQSVQVRLLQAPIRQDLVDFYLQE